MAPIETANVSPPRSLISAPNRPIATRPSSFSYLRQFWSILTESQRARLEEQIAAIDFDQMSTLVESHSTSCQHDGTVRLDAPSEVIAADSRQSNPELFAAARELGWQTLRAGRVGVILVAGGEGTRLGFPHPKGKFPIGPVTGNSLYQCLAEQVLAISDRAGVTVPYYVMTSDATHAETVDFFEEHSYFGLDRQHVTFFRQGNMPAIDQKSGRILMSANDSIAFSPDGHGGVLAAMENAGIFYDLRERGIEHLFYHQVDNPLVRVCDPAFVGFHVRRRADVSSKFIAKADPAEKVGLLVEIDGRQQIVEYIDIPPDLAEERDGAGRLKLRCGNIAVHLFRTSFLERVTHESEALPYHRSSKAVPYMNDAGHLVQPEECNAFKFEKFIFDILPHAERTLAVEAIRDEEFVPLKNREGLFSAEHVRHAMQQLHTSWLKHAGWTTAEELPVEIPPAVALDETEFLEKFDRIASSPLMETTNAVTPRLPDRDLQIE